MSSLCYGEDDRRRSAAKDCPIDALVTCATTDGIVSLLRYPAFLALSCETLSTPISRACTVCFGGGFQSSWAVCVVDLSFSLSLHTPFPPCTESALHVRVQQGRSVHR